MFHDQNRIALEFAHGKKMVTDMFMAYGRPAVASFQGKSVDAPFLLLANSGASILMATSRASAGVKTPLSTTPIAPRPMYPITSYWRDFEIQL